ncbi:MAG: adenosylcobinamide amidohydrolase, partial [Acidobacteriota bacterium]|nr:adenosylcobinamide amidohydrolase [Acidobacteriota bacterium]
ATGTGTDQFCLAAPLDPGRKARDSTSPHVKLGEIIGVAVKDATKEALRWQSGLEPSSVRGLFHALGRFGLTEGRALSGLAELLPEAQHAFLQKNRKAVFFAPGVAAAAYAFAAVLDRIAFGTLPAGMAQESLRQQAASLACSLAARPQDWPLFRRELAETGEEPDDAMDLVIRALALGWKSKWT